MRAWYGEGPKGPAGPNPGLRGCSACGRPITGCFGYSLAGDVMSVDSGALPRRALAVRELCGWCVEAREGRI